MDVSVDGTNLGNSSLTFVYTDLSSHHSSLASVWSYSRTHSRDIDGGLHCGGDDVQLRRTAQYGG